jgi:hypothetical protein
MAWGVPPYLVQGVPAGPGIPGASGVVLVTETQTVDLAAWLTQIWDEREKACREAQEAIDTYTATAGQGDLELRWMLQLRRGGVFQGGWDMPGPPTPAEDLARIAADRKILELHKHTVDPFGWIDCATCGEAGHEVNRVQWCLHVRLLASPYVDSPGYVEEWAP